MTSEAAPLDFALRGESLSRDWMAARPGHVPGLDGLRGISIIIVLCAHFISGTIFPGGIGVYIFFVISGFLITRLLFSELKFTGNISLPKFYFRRLLRLYPALIVYSAITIAAFIALGKKFPQIELFSAMFYFANYWYWDGRPEIAPFRIFWSLSVEEHFYLLLPAAVVLLRRPALIAKLMCAVAAICLAIRLAAAWTHPELLSTKYFYFRSECRLDSLGFGVLIACLAETPRGRAFLLRLATYVSFGLALALLAACMALRDAFFRETIRYTLLGVSISVIVAFVLFRDSAASIVLNNKALAWVGKLSYSLYIWHVAVWPLLEHFGHGLNAVETIPISFITAFLLASLSYYVIEKPLMRLRARLHPDNADSPSRRERQLHEKIAEQVSMRAPPPQ